MPDATPARDELRIALVMTGGVSLAIWMGGIANELNRLLHGQGVYGELLDHLDYTPRVDVITGTSAGGLNGALLATAVARNQDISWVRELWAKDGSIAALLRDPRDRTARSLLQGDDAFYPALEGAFAKLLGNVKPFEQQYPLREPNAPIHLTVTTTLLHGEPHTYADDFGSLISEPEHRGTFTFVRGPDDRDDFTGDHASARLARAVRSSASFPFAFEASYSPGSDDAPLDGVDMHGIASFHQGRFLVDGGVLDNKPLRAALQQIYAQPATLPVRRVLAYVNPLPDAATPGEADSPDQPPTLGTVVSKSIVGIRAVESLAADLQATQDHNRHVRNHRESRDVLATSLAGDTDRLADVARALFPAYRTTRLQGSITRIVGCIVARASDDDRGYVYDLRTLQSVLDEALHGGPVPFNPPPWRASEPLPLRGYWRWGIYALEGISATALELLVRTQALARFFGKDAAAIEVLRTRVHDAIATIAELRHADAEHWADGAAEGFRQVEILSKPTSDAATRLAARSALLAWARRLVHTWFAPAPSAASTPPRPRPRRAMSDAAREIGQVLVDARPIITELLDGIPASVDRGEAVAIRSLVDLVAPAGGAAIDSLRSLLALEVVSGALQTPDRDVDQTVEMFQISATTPNSLRIAPPADEKLAGAQLFHFGAFYKRSWRYNDWTWGRLDGCHRMVQLLLEPARFAKAVDAMHPDAALADRTQRGCDLVRELAIDNEKDGPRRAYLERYWANEAPLILHELSFLAVPELQPPSSLPLCTRVIARRLQLETACVEMPYVRAAVEADAVDRDRDLAPLGNLKPFAPDEAVAELETCDLGAEPILEEAGTNRFLDVTTRAAAVTTAALENPDGGLGPARRVARPLRGLSLALYWVAQGFTQATPLATVAFLGVLAVSGAVLTVVLATGNYSQLPAVVTLIVVAAVIIGMFVWARAIGYKLAGLAILAIVVLGVAIFVMPTFESGTDHDGTRSALLVARPFLLGVLIIGGLVVLGGLGRTRSVDVAKSVAVVLIVAAVVVGAVVVVAKARDALDVHEERDAQANALALVRRVDRGKVSDSLHVSAPSLVHGTAPFVGVARTPSGLLVHLDTGISDDAGGELHAWAFDSGDSAGTFLDQQVKDAAGHPRCRVASRTVMCWSREGDVVIGAASTSQQEAEALLAARSALPLDG